MARNKDLNWDTEQRTWDAIQVAVLMDLRDELKASRAELRAINNDMSVIRHWFHQAGLQSAMRAVIARTNKQDREQKRALAEKRCAAKAAERSSNAR